MSSRTVKTVRLDGHDGVVDLHITDGVIARIEPAEDPDAGFDGGWAFPGFAESHLHLDKVHLLDRTGAGDLDAAVRETAQAKRDATVEDIRHRARRVIERAVGFGTTLIRSHVEVDPDAELRAWRALCELQTEYADTVELVLTPFAQNGTTASPETIDMLRRAIADGRGSVTSVGGCPYTDDDPAGHIRTLIDLAIEHDLDVDFHVDLDLEPEWDHLTLILDETERRSWQGRVSVGHATKLAALSPQRRAALTRRLADAGVTLTVLPSTDLYLEGRSTDRLWPRAVAPRLDHEGVRMTISTNNVCNAFTPYGDANLLRMANLYANLTHASTDDDMLGVWSMVTSGPERLLGRPRSLAVGQPATLVVLDAPDPVSAVREVRQPMAGFFVGRPTFTWDRPVLL